MIDGLDPSEDDAAPICQFCGVSALQPEVPGDPFRCENADCEAFGDPI